MLALRWVQRSPSILSANPVVIAPSLASLKTVHSQRASGKTSGLNPTQPSHTSPALRTKPMPTICEKFSHKLPTSMQGIITLVTVEESAMDLEAESEHGARGR